MTQEETISKLNQMKMFALATSLKERLARADHQDLSHEDFFGLLIDDEWIARENRKRQRRLTQAKFKVQTSMEEIDYQLKRSLVKAKILDLSTFKWISHHQNILILGPTGIGKSFIAQALGHQACYKGYTVHYVRLSKLLHDLYLSRAE